jgi:hypothetical protein
MSRDEKEGAEAADALGALGDLRETAGVVEKSVSRVENAGLAAGKAALGRSPAVGKEMRFVSLETPEY